MKVAFVTAFPKDPARPVGGVEAVSVILARALSEIDDLDIHVVTTDTDRSRAGVMKWDRVNVHVLPREEMKTLIYAIGPGRNQVKKYVTALAPDVIHAHDNYGLMVKGLNIPRVFTIHGFIYADTAYSGGIPGGLRSLLWRWLEIGGWRDQPNIISISPYVRERLQKYVNSAIYDINNPVSEEFFGITKREIKGTIFSSAMICPRKNTFALVKALAELRQRGVDAKLRLAGPSTDTVYSDKIKLFIAENGISEYVEFLGRIGREKIKEELSGASIYALASFEENAPIGVEEAMAAGVPVVTSNRCGMPYMVKHGVSGLLVDPLDVSAITEAFYSMLKDDRLRDSMGKSSRTAAEKEFHPRIIAGLTRDVYNKAVAGWHERGKR